MNRTLCIILTVLLLSVQESACNTCTSGSYWSGLTCTPCPNGTWVYWPTATNVSECIAYKCTTKTKCANETSTPAGASICINSNFTAANSSNPSDNTLIFVVVGIVVGVGAAGGGVAILVLTHTGAGQENIRDDSQRIAFFKTPQDRVPVERSGVRGDLHYVDVLRGQIPHRYTVKY
jgi:hypothetical protein